MSQFFSTCASFPGSVDTCSLFSHFNYTLAWLDLSPGQGAGSLSIFIMAHISLHFNELSALRTIVRTLTSRKVETFYTGKGSQPRPEKEGIHVQVYPMVALILIAYSIILVLGETLRAHFFVEGSRKNKLFSGPFVLLKIKPNISPPLLTLACSTFAQFVFPVRNNV